MKRTSFAISLLYLSCMATNATFATTSAKPIDYTIHYLDSSIWNTIVEENACFNASPNALLVVEPITNGSHRQYKISQYFDQSIARSLYAKPVSEQIHERKIVGRKFCEGIVSISNMDLPFTKNSLNIGDLNDGVLLADKLQMQMVKMWKGLHVMKNLAVTASTGSYQTYELEAFDQEFHAQLDLIESMANNSRFNGIALMNGDVPVLEIPKDGQGEYFTMALQNLSTGSSGLNISSEEICSNSNAQSAVDALHSALQTMDTTYNVVVANKVRLQAMAKQKADVAYISVKNDDFMVQHKKSSIDLED